VTETYFIEDVPLTIDLVRQRLRREEAAKKRRGYRVTVASIVVFLHLAVIAMLVAVKVTVPVREKPPQPAQLLWLLLPPAQEAQGTRSEQEAEDLVRRAYKAVQLLPRLNREGESNAITMEPGQALGAAIACGAGSFEYLTEEGQRRCRHRPWHFTYDRYGYLVMDARNLPPPAKKPHRGSVLEKERYTPDRCPKNVDPNAPCLDRIIRGN
jgi:hypothetical protein